MSIDITTISQTSLSINEDICGYNSHAVWILDGATSISGRRTLINNKQESDASWFVGRFSHDFAKLDTYSDLVTQIKSITQDINAQSSGVWGDWGQQDIPSASFSAAIYDDRNVVLSNLGDCRVLYQLDDGSIQHFGHSNVDALDRDLLEQYKSLAKESPRANHKVIWQQLVDQIRANRLLMNRPDGYWILGPDGSGVDHLQQIRLSYQNQAKILLSTDGLYRLVDTYGQMTDQQFFTRAFEANGLNQLLTQLREIEKNDPEALDYPRVKLQDDASAVLLHINR
ncbi:hypothetical protein ALP72_02718 [Pseudomonas coronafaciens pv. coronafaciens]|uniref:protein phosphatase 2C domain-containing protein n=1 Tax=Pseudomonas coronafaciens TaxID=53409 RepID=UPI000EFF2FE7|nr:protein phosphatase 2C domain-containing protein [Pseudomonas coronafaciens]RMS07883.1 hypothetical protein ALP72_02718 [Pseudomonas coronafaciens pv. coronafaciens]